MKKTAGTIIVRYLGFGILTLLFLIIGAKTLASQTVYLTLGLAGVIFIVNMVVVLGYTFAIIRSDEMLSEEDAPDLAYYLGFSLTVASLALSFISDVGMGADAEASSNLVKGSLAQFGSGLLATLIGLCAKIFIASKQAHLASNPEILYQEFRKEIRGFENALNGMATSLDVSISAACVSINKSAESAADSMEKLSARLKAGSDSIAENLTVEKIARPIAAFSEELFKLQAPAKDFRDEMSSLVNSASSITKGFAGLDTSISDVRKSTLEEIKNIDGLVETKKRLNDTSKLSIDLLTEQNTAITESNKQLIRLKNNSSKTSDSFELVATVSEKLVIRSGELNDGFSTVISSIQETTQKISELINLTSSLCASLKASGDGVDLFSAQTNSINSALSAALNTFSEINIALKDAPAYLDNTLKSLNALSYSLSKTAISTEPFVRSLNNVNVPLDRTSESATALNSAILKLNQDVESLARFFASNLNRDQV